MRQFLIGAACLFFTAAALAQPGTAHMAAGIDRDSVEAMEAQSKTLLTQAEISPNGLATVTLKKYPGHYTMLAVRAKTGGAEMHANANDIFFVLDGDATEITGGAIVAPKEISPGETRGDSIDGGVSIPMRKGDIVHIDPNTPHQTILQPGHTFTYYVIKVATSKD